MRQRDLLAAMVLTAACVAGGASAQSTQAEPRATTQPSLAALDGEVQQLYRDAQQRTVRVIVPIHLPTRLLEQEHPLAKWAPQLDPKLLQQLQSAKARGDTRVFVEARVASTQPTSSESSPAQTSQLGGDGSRVPLPQETAVVNAEFIGLVLDQRGDVLVPLYIDAAYLEAPLHVTVDDRRVTSAQVVAADRLTSLSVLRLAEPTGEPMRFATTKPSAGSLMLMLAPTRRSARLTVWSGTADENAILLTLSGEVAGIVRNGHALFPSMFLPVVKQLAAGMPVRRAALGVMIRELPPDDPQRAKVSPLGSRPAARVEEVFENTAAARAGILRGDVILSLGDEPVEDVATFAAAIANYRGRTPLRIIRDGREQTVTADLQSD